jgi:hypothetical protein
MGTRPRPIRLVREKANRLLDRSNKCSYCHPALHIRQSRRITGLPALTAQTWGQSYRSASPSDPPPTSLRQMRHRNPPDPSQDRANFVRVASDPQTKAWAKRLLGDSAAVPSGLSEAQLAFIGAELIKRREEDFRQDAYLAEMEATCPVLAFPDMTDPVEDLRSCPPRRSTRRHGSPSRRGRCAGGRCVGAARTTAHRLPETLPGASPAPRAKRSTPVPSPRTLARRGGAL